MAQAAATEPIRVQGLALYRKQFESVWDPSRVVCIESTTKSGKTRSCLQWQFTLVLEGRPHADHWWVAPSYSQAGMAFRLAWRLYGLPLQSLGASANRSDLVITMPNQARWVFKTAEKPDLLYGEKVWSLVIDEASRCRDEAIHACWSTMTVTRGPIRMIGNVRGRHNLHYQWSRKGEAGEPGFAYHRITADDAVSAGVFRREDVEAARSALPHAVFRQLYYCEPADDGDNPFGVQHIEACVTRCGGQLSPGPVRVWGFDYARNTDWSVLVGLNQRREVCAFERWHGEPAYSRQRLIDTVKASGAPVVVDATGMGDHLVDDLSRAGLKVEGYTLTNASKQHLIEGLALAIQSRATSVLDGPHRAELEAFEYRLSASRSVQFAAPPGAHDDCVIAHALAWYGAERWGVRERVGSALPSVSPRATAARIF